nr:ABC-2 transporter permease [uncultured Sellimonas sp.]
MKGFMVKEWCLLKEFRKLMAIIIFVSVILTFSGSDVSFVVGYIVVLMAMVAGMSIAYDEANGGMTFLMTLPATRKQYVISKYVFGLVLFFFSCLYAVILQVFYYMVYPSRLDMKFTLTLVSAMILIGIISISVSIPVELKFGGEKGRIIFIILVMGIALAAVFIGKMMRKMDSELARTWIHRLNLLFTGKMFPVYCILASAIIMAVSILVSIWIIQKKEF